MKADNVHIDNNTRGDLGRWIGLLLSASAWAAQLQALYLTSEYGCDGGDFTWNHVVFAVALAFAIVGGIIAWRSAPLGKLDAKDLEHKRFLSLLGIVLAVFFSVVITAQWLPTLVGVPCHK